MDDGFEYLNMEWRGGSHVCDWFSDNPDAKIQLRALLINDHNERQNSRPRKPPAAGHDFLQIINKKLVPWVIENWPFPETDIKVKPISSEQTAFTMLHELGFRYGRPKKEPYFVGHEKPENVEARKKFCALLLQLLQQATFAGPIDKNEENITWHKPNETEYMFFAHDEFCMGAKEGPTRVWSFAQDFFFKDKGRMVMVSDVITSDPQRYGRF